MGNAIFRRWRAVVCITTHLLPEERVGRGIRRIIVVAAAQTVRLGWPDDEPFIPIGKYYTDGCFEQPDIFVAEVPGARVHIGSGMACTPDFKVLADSGRLDRVPCFSAFGQRKPHWMERRSGLFSTIHYCYAHNVWHWFYDCLPKLVSLHRALPDRKLTLLMPDAMTPLQRRAAARAAG